MKKRMLCLAALAALGAAGVRAEDSIKTVDPPKAEKSKTGTAADPLAPGQQKQVDKLAAEFDVAKEEIIGLRSKGFGWGEVRHALTLARRAGKPVGDILKMREAGLGWGAIARKEGVRLGPDRAGRGVPDPRVERGMGRRDHGAGEHGRGRGK